MDLRAPKESRNGACLPLAAIGIPSMQYGLEPLIRPATDGAEGGLRNGFRQHNKNCAAVARYGPTRS